MFRGLWLSEPVNIQLFDGQPKLNTNIRGRGCPIDLCDGGCLSGRPAALHHTDSSCPCDRLGYCRFGAWLTSETVRKSKAIAGRESNAEACLESGRTSPVEDSDRDGREWSLDENYLGVAPPPNHSEADLGGQYVTPSYHS